MNVWWLITGVHKSFHLTIRDGSTWSKFGARGEHGDVLRFSTEVFSGSPTSGSWEVKNSIFSYASSSTLHPRQ